MFTDMSTPVYTLHITPDYDAQTSRGYGAQKNRGISQTDTPSVVQMYVLSATFEQ